LENGGIHQPEMVGRAGELAILKEKLADASRSNGSTVFISGEAGLGKTRLVSELIKLAEAKDFRIIQSWCLAENLEPLMPVKTALREASLMHLVSGDPPPLVISAYLVDDNGIPIAKSEREGLTLDPLIFSSMLKAVGDFVKDSMAMVDGAERTGGLNILGYGDYKIIMEEDDGLHLACVTKGCLNEFLTTDMREVLAGIQTDFGHILKVWNGDMDMVKGVGDHVSGLVKSGKYSGRFLVDDPKLKQENLFDNVLLGLQRASAVKPLVFFLDDMQWSDPTSLNLLHYLARNIKSSRILILGAYRPEDITQTALGKPHPLETVMQEMSREDCLERLELGRLDLECTEKVIISALGRSALEGDFFEMVHAETGGTPLFIIEVIKMLLAENMMVRDGAGDWSLAGSPEKLELPGKVYEVVKRRLDRLTREQHEILECAAVIGEEFSTDVLGRICGLGRMSLLRSLAEIENSHRLIHSSGKTYRFDHAKVREVLYSDIMDELREEYHRLVADTMWELNHENLVPALNDLAYHYHQANDPRAGNYLVKVGDMAWGRYSNQEAINAYRNALDFLPDEETPLIIERLGDLLALTGSYEQAIETFEKLVDKDVATGARMLRKIGDVHLSMGDFGLSLDVLSRARTMANGSELGRVIFGEGCAHQRKGDNHMALDLIKEALILFENAGEKKDIANAFRFIGTIHLNNGNYEDAMFHYKRSLEMMESLREENGAAAALVNIGIVFWNRGEYGKALEFYGQSLGIMVKIGNLAGTATVLANIGLLYWDKGELERSLEHQERGLLIFEKIGDQRGIASVLGNISLVHRDNGCLEAALKFQERSLGMRERMGDQSGIALSLSNIAELHRDMGNLEMAMEIHRMSLDICQDIGDKRVSIHNLCGIAEACMIMGNAASALENSAKAVDASIQIGAKFEEGMSRRVMGMALRNSGDFENAAVEFDRSGKVFDEMGDKKEMAKLLYEMAVLHRTRGTLDKAKVHFEKALDEFARMGMRLWVDKCRDALGSLIP